jgi:hypothetical protein
MCPAGVGDLGRISQEDVIRYIERHARDWSAESGKAMCWSLRAFLRYLHHRGLNPLTLAGCVPSIRRWKFASLPTYLSAAPVRKVLGSCDRATALSLWDYAILMMLAKLGMRAGEIVALTLNDMDWRTGEMLIHAKEDSAPGCRSHQMSAQPSLPTCVMDEAQGHEHHHEARDRVGDAAARSACVLGVAVDRRAVLRAQRRKHRSEDGGAARRPLAGIEACQALCLRRRRDRCVAGGGAGTAKMGCADGPITACSG